MRAPKQSVHADSTTTRTRGITRLILAVAGAAVLGAGIPAGANAQALWQQPEFMIGTWEDPITPALGSSDLHYYQQVKDGYFNLLTGTVLHPGGTHFSLPTASQQRDRLDAASRVGLFTLISNAQHTGVPGEIAPPFDPAFPPLIFRLYDQNDADAITNAHNDAMLGYNLWDEPVFTSSNAEFIKSWASAIHNDNVVRADGHQRIAYLNAFPGCGGGYACYPSALALLAADADPSRRLDVMSTDLYPFAASASGPIYSHFYWAAMRDLRSTMGDRPFWVITMASPSAGGGWASDPDEAQLRFMAFCPPAAGAKGIIWFNYRSQAPVASASDYPLLGTDITTCKYERIRTINHYLKDVVGPVVMTTTHLGVFQQANMPVMDDDPYLSFVASAPAAACPATDLGNPNLAVGVFQSPTNTNEYYLLLVNKSLSSQTGTVSLRASYAVSAAPSVVDYHGESAFQPLTTGSNFAVSLAGGEGRMYRLAQAPSNALRLISPAGGEYWRPGEVHVVTWSPAEEAVDVQLVADVLDGADGVTGPSTLLASGVAGGSFMFTMPNVSSRAAHVVLLGNEIASHNKPLHTAPVEQAELSTTLFTSAGCNLLGGDLTLDSFGTPVVAYCSFPATLQTQRLVDQTWTHSAPYGTSPTPLGVGASASVTIDASGYTHIAHASDYTTGTQALSLSHSTPGGAWTHEVVMPSIESTSCALAITPAGELRVASSDVESGGHLTIRHKVNGEWVDIGPMPNSAHPHDIDLAVDAAGNTYVAFIDGEPALERCVVAKVTATTATTMLVLQGQFRAVSLALDPTGKPAIAYVQETGMDGANTLRYRAYTGTAWGTIKLVDGTPGTIAGCSLAFEGSNPRIAYVGNRVAKYASLNGTTWTSSTLYGGADADAPVSLKFDASGHRWAAFFDRSSDGFRVVGPPSNGGGGDGGCPTCEPGEILPAVTFRFDNPVQLGRALAFDLRLSRGASIEMALFDVAGRRVAHFPARSFGAGVQHIEWTPKPSRPGAYFLRMQSDGQTLSQKRLIMLQ